MLLVFRSTGSLVPVVSGRKSKTAHVGGRTKTKNVAGTSGGDGGEFGKSSQDGSPIARRASVVFGPSENTVIPNQISTSSESASHYVPILKPAQMLR